MKYSIVFVTVSSKDEALKITDTLVKEKLAACVNIVGGVQSVYWWKGAIEQAAEYLLIIKTKRALVPSLVKRIQHLHSYSVPEIIAMDIAAGNPDYLRWIDESCLKHHSRK